MKAHWPSSEKAISVLFLVALKAVEKQNVQCVTGYHSFISTYQKKKKVCGHFLIQVCKMIQFYF